MALLLRRTQYKRERLDPLLIPLVTEVLTHLPENPAEFIIAQLAQHKADGVTNEKATEERLKEHLKEKGDLPAAMDGKHFHPETKTEIEAQNEKKIAHLMQLSTKQETLLVLPILLVTLMPLFHMFSLN